MQFKLLKTIAKSRLLRAALVPIATQPRVLSLARALSPDRRAVPVTSPWCQQIGRKKACGGNPKGARVKINE